MHLNDNHLLKTLGPLAARLVATLYANNRHSLDETKYTPVVFK